MTLPHDTTRCATPCTLADRCRRTDPISREYQSYTAFPGGEDCDGFIERFPPPVRMVLDAEEPKGARE